MIYYLCCSPLTFTESRVSRHGGLRGGHEEGFGRGASGMHGPSGPSGYGGASRMLTIILALLEGVMWYKAFRGPFRRGFGTRLHKTVSKSLDSYRTCRGLPQYLIPIGFLGSVQDETYQGWSPLMCACSCGNESTVKLLIEKGANVNFRTKVNLKSA